MTRLAKITDGLVQNVAVFPSADLAPADWVECGDAGIGWTYDGTTFAPPAEPDPIVTWRDTATLSRRQFCLACLQAGLLTPDDAVTAAAGGWPASFDAALAGLSEIEVAAAKVEWAAVSVIRRSAPLLSVVQATAGVTDEQVDALFGWVG